MICDWIYETGHVSVWVRTTPLHISHNRLYFITVMEYLYSVTCITKPYDYLIINNGRKSRGYFIIT